MEQTLLRMILLVALMLGPAALGACTGPQPAPTPAAVAGTSSPAPPSQEPEPTVVTVAPTSKPTPSPLPAPWPFAPLLYDDFSRPDSGWTPLFVDQRGSANGYSAEAFAISTVSAGQLLYTTLPNLSFAPSRYSVDLQAAEGAGMLGLMLEVRGDPANYAGMAFYGAGLTTGGDLVLLVKGSAADLQLLTLAQNVAPALAGAAPARLIIDRYPDRLTVQVEGGELFSVTMPPPEGGTVGFFARADNRLVARFDNLLLTSGPPGDGPPCAELRPLFVAPAGNEALAGADLLIVQSRLARLGYDPGPEEPYSAEMATAVAAFQARNDLPADGVVDGRTWCRLLSAEAVLAGQDQPEAVAMADRYRPVTINLEAGLPAPLLVSVRGAGELWRIALALPDRAGLHYIDTGGDALDADWLPGEGLLAFTSTRAGDDQEAVWIFDTRSGQARQVSPPGLAGSFPAWSPDGKTLLFNVTFLEGGRRRARGYIYSRAEGRATEWSAEYAGWTDWSPFGPVVFTGWTGRSFDLFVAGPDGTAPINLTNSDDYHEDIAAWSPAGDQIAYVRNPVESLDDRQVWVMQADGGEARQLTRMPGPNSNPIWLDATTIIFAHQPSEEIRRPYILRLPGEPRPLSSGDERIWFMGRFELGS